MRLRTLARDALCVGIGALVAGTLALAPIGEARTRHHYTPYQRHVLLVVASIGNTVHGRADNVAWLARLTAAQQQRIWDVDNMIADLCAELGTPLGGPDGCGL